MKHPQQRETLWDQLLRAFDAWLGEEDDEQASDDPSLMFHLMLTAPLIIGLLLLARRAA
jgi:hypothetical protein